MANLTYAQVSKLLKYDPTTGKLFWLPRTPDMFKEGAHSAEHSCALWNARYANQEALYQLSGTGYRRGTIYARPYRAHRVIWLLHTGAWPSDQIDHINGDRDDNRIVNLRDVTNLENRMNHRRRNDNKSGFQGISWSRQYRKWRVEIKVDGRAKHLGRFDDIEEAVRVRKAAEITYGYHPNHGRD